MAVRRIELGGTIWVCTDCMIVHANGEENPDRRADEPETWALWDDDKYELAMGMSREEHNDGCPNSNDDTWGREDCDCEELSFTWSSCDGCGSTLGGERYAFTYWIVTS